MDNHYPGSLKGQFLIAMPTLMDPNFSMTITYICEHTAGGALGLVINRVHPSLCGKDLFEELKIAYIPQFQSIPIHIGGPVHMGEVFILHGQPLDWEGSLGVSAGLALSNTRDILEAIAVGRGPQSFIIALGCAGWGADQLEGEIKANTWLTSPAFEDIIFELPVEERWAKALEQLGIDPAWLSGTAGHA
jgi:putative transcriptional regulator